MRVRTLHHLSATGGTLFSHAIASQKDTYLLSELNPLNQAGVRFAPIDPFQQFGAQYGELSLSQYLDEFLRRLRIVCEIVSRKNGTLVIRDHSHTDWLQRECRGYSALLATLREEYETQSIVTVRHPIEAYSSLIANDWHGAVGSFDRYCERGSAFLDYFSDTPIFRYEDFVLEPDRWLPEICDALDIPFSPDWRKRYRKITLTGDSGRGPELGRTVRPLPVKEIDAGLRREIDRSENFRLLADRLGYLRCPDELAKERRLEIDRAAIGS